METTGIMPLPVYVLATDGRLYRNPEITGAVVSAGRKRSEWAVVFDSQEAPQFLLEVVPGLTFEIAERTAASALKAAGVVANVRGASRQVRLLGDRVEWCFVFDLEILAPIPAEALGRTDGVMQPAGEHVLYSFGRTWG